MCGGSEDDFLCRLMPRPWPQHAPRVKMVMPGLRSLHATVRLPLLLCVVVVLLLLVMNMQLNSLVNRSLEDAALHAHSSGAGLSGVSRLEREFVVPGGSKVVRAGRPGLLEAVEPIQEPVLAGEGGVDGRGDRQNSAADLGDGEDQAPVQQQEVQPPAKQNPPVEAEKKPQQQQQVSGGHDIPTITDSEIAAYTQVLEMRMAEAGTKFGWVGTRNCSYLASLNNTRGVCVDTTCPRHFHPSAQQRVRELVTPKHMQVTREERERVLEIGKSLPRRRYIFVTAASSNHYNESQALVYSMRHHVLPKLPPDSYSFYYFDLGLKAAERRRVEKHCNCTVLSFPLSALPPHARHLMCYAWKPVIIQTLLHKAEVLVYMDVSVRFRDMELDLFFQGARHWGAQFLSSQDSIPNHTVEPTFAFYGDVPCMYWPYPELLAGFSVLHNEPFVQRVVLEPWLACAFNATCMCPVDPHAYRNCPHTERRVGQCHRFDLSSLTLQMAKLYGPTFGHLALRTNHPPKVARNDKMGFFTD